jgi:hypothetical protein
VAEGFLPGGVAIGFLEFALGGVVVMEEELGDVGEGGSFGAGDAVLGEEKEEFSEDAGEVGGGGELASEGGEFGGDGGRVEELLLLAGVEGAEGGVGVVAEHGALAAVGGGEEAAGGGVGGGTIAGEMLCFHRVAPEKRGNEVVRYRGNEWESGELAARGRGVRLTTGKSSMDVTECQ